MIQLDLNNPEFQTNLLAMPKPEAWAVLKTLRLLQGMSWEQLQRSKGLRWELIQSRQLRPELMGRYPPFLSPIDQGMGGGLGFSLDQQLFVELLARAQASADDCDVAIRMGGIAHRSRQNIEPISF